MCAKILHLADLHLDTPFKSVEKVSSELASRMQRATYQSFERLVQFAIDEQVDGVLIVGDCFNSAKPSVSTQYFFKEQLEKLVAQNIFVCVSYGNHDFMHKPLLVELPKAVHQMSSTVETITFETKQHETIAVSGFSYATQHIKESQLMHYPNKSTAHYHIGMLHGDTSTNDVSGNCYAPFTVTQLNAKQYDYWALGHIHKQTIVQSEPPIAYSGCIQGLHQNETGEKGGLLVTLTKNQFAQLTPVYSSVIVWEKLTLTLKETDTFDTFLTRAKQTLASLLSEKMDEKFYVIQLHVTCDNGVDHELVDSIQSNDFKMLLETAHAIIFKVTCQFDYTQPLFLNDQLVNKWHKLVENGLEQAHFEQALTPFFANKHIKVLLSEMFNDKQFLHTLQERALQKLLYEMRDTTEN